MRTARLHSKEDIEYHSDRGYDHKPAVNVKVYTSLEEGFRQFVESEGEVHPEFTVEWIEENLTDEEQWAAFNSSCEWRWEDLQMKAEEEYGNGVKVYSEGRQGGWAYIDGINTDVDSWDAIEFSRWKRFAEFARATADGIMYDVVWSIHANIFEPAKEAEHDEWLHVEPNYPEGIKSA